MDASTTGGVIVEGSAQVAVSGDIVGRDKIVGYTSDQVTALLSQISSTFQPKAFSGRAPYIGLDVFDQSHADLFFGREELVQELLTRIKQTRFLIITGPSGSGKSSLARAGLLNALQRGALPGSDEWLYGTLKPGRNPLQELGRVAAGLARALNAGDEISARGMQDASVFHRWMEIALGDARDRRAVILIDQFEEIFTQVQNEEARAPFLDQLTHAATVPDGRTILVLCLRSDFVPNCARYPRLNELLNRQFLQVGAMQPEELVRAVALPALKVGLRVDPDLIAQIVSDMRGEPGALPLMQFALKDLFDAQQASGGVIALTRQDFLARGGIRKALVRHADEVFAKLDPEEQDLAQAIFSRLIQLGRRNQATRRIAMLDELTVPGGDPARVQGVVAKLADARLLTTDGQGTEQTVTLAHETLIDAWPWLRKLVEENREAIALQNVIADDAMPWAQHGRDESYLYRGVQLAAVQKQLVAKRLVLDDNAQEFIDASIATFDKEQRTKNRALWTLRALGIALVLILGAFGFASYQQLQATRAAQQAKDEATAFQIQAANSQSAEIAAHAAEIVERKNSLSGRLAAAALAQLSVDPEFGLLLALEAARTAETAQADQALREAYQAPYARLILAGHNDRLNSVEYSPDRQLIATASDDHTVKVWDARTGQLLQTLTGHSGIVRTVKFSPDSRWVVSAGKDDVVMVDGARTGERVAILTGHGGEVSNAEFSPDGKWVLTGDADKNVRVWDIATQKPIAVLSGHSAGITRATFSKGGKMVGSSSLDATARLWDVSAATAGKVLTPAPLSILGANPTEAHTGTIWDIDLSPDGKYVVTAGNDKTARLWDVTSGKLLWTFKGPDRFVRRARFSPDSQLVVTAWGDGTARVYNTVTGATVTVLAGLTDSLQSVEFSPNGNWVVGTSSSGALVWGAKTGVVIAAVVGRGIEVNSAQFSSDNRFLLTANKDGTAREWDLGTGIDLSSAAGHIRGIGDAHYSRDGRWVLTAGGDNTAKVWEAATGRLVSTLDATQDKVLDPVASALANAERAGTNEPNAPRVLDAAFSPDGTLAATVGTDGWLRLWNLGSGAPPLKLGQHDMPVMGVQFSPDGQWLLTASDDQTARLTNLTPPYRSITLLGHDASLTGARYSADGAWIVTTSLDKKDSQNSTVRLWRTAAAVQAQGVFRDALSLDAQTAVWAADFSPDGQSLVTARSDKTARLWDLRALLADTSGEPRYVELRGHLAPVREAIFSPDGKYVVTTSEDKTARVWDAGTGAFVAALNGHTNWILHASFRPDGQLVATTGRDGTTRLWFPGSGVSCATLRGHTGFVNSVVFSPDGESVLTGGDDKTARIFGTQACSALPLLRALAAARVKRELACEERRQYLQDQEPCATATPPSITSLPKP